MLRFLLRFLRLGCLISQGGVMTNNALIYRRPSKWPIAAALAAAVLIHLSAVAIAFHQESPAHTTSCNRSHDYRGLLRCRSADPSARSRYFCPAARTGSGSRFHRTSGNSSRDQNATDPRSHSAIRANTASRSGKCEGVRAQRAAAGLPIRSAQPPYYRERRRRDQRGSRQWAGRGCDDGAKHR